MRGEYVGSRSLPSTNTYGRPSSPCTSRNAATPVASIAVRTREHLRAALARRRLPFAVEVGAGGVGAQVAAHAAVGVHVRHDVEHRALEEAARDRVGGVEQPLEHALDEPLGHRLARMLAGDHPDRLAPRALLADGRRDSCRGRRRSGRGRAPARAAKPPRVPGAPGDAPTSTARSTRSRCCRARPRARS